jgi:site-specific recombinase XerD
MLKQAIEDFLSWMISVDYSQSTWERFERSLRHFFVFVSSRQIAWEDIFTPSILAGFIEESSDKRYARYSVRGLWRYLFKQGRVTERLSKKQNLPQLYEEYLSYYGHKVLYGHVQRTRKILSALVDYLRKHNIFFSKIKIEDIDAFLAEYNQSYTAHVRKSNRSCLRGFLRYLYQERGILQKDFACLLIGAPIYAEAKPPKFLRAHEIQKLFKSISPSSAWELRAYAMLHLAYTLGLRPKEISLISLDDISFSKGEISLPDRKNTQPIVLPLPEDTIKAIAAYIVGGRANRSERQLFLTLRAPYGPICSALVGNNINTYLRKVNSIASAYWLRHTYAQNLLETGASIFEIKEMLGHKKIRSTERYLHIHTKLMREVLFDETI